MRKTRSFLLGFLISALIFSSITIFADTTEIKAFLSDIKINLDGKILELKDSQGNKITPIVYNGTTYLPVRAIAESLGKEVQWDEKTNTVIITSKKELGGEVMQPNVIPSDIQFAKEGNLEIVIFEGKKYATPVDIAKSIYKDYGIPIVAGEVNRETSTIDFYYRNVKNDPLIENYPVVLLAISSHSFAISYDDYKNDLLPRILQAVEQQN